MVEQIHIRKDKVLLTQNVGRSVRHAECLSVDRPPVLDDLYLIPGLSFDCFAYVEDISGKDMASFGVTV